MEITFRELEAAFDNGTITYSEFLSMGCVWLELNYPNKEKN